jgi:hypothetical protein
MSNGALNTNTITNTSGNKFVNVQLGGTGGTNTFNPTITSQNYNSYTTPYTYNFQPNVLK